MTPPRFEGVFRNPPKLGYPPKPGVVKVALPPENLGVPVNPYPTVFVSQLILSLHYPCVFLHYLTVHVTPVTLSYSVFVTPKKLSEELKILSIYSEYYPKRTVCSVTLKRLSNCACHAQNHSKDYLSTRVTPKRLSNCACHAQKIIQLCVLG